MDCHEAIDLVGEIMKISRWFIPLWILIGAIIGVGIKQLFDDISRRE